MDTFLAFLRDYGALIGTILASATALLIAVGGEWLKSLIFKPELVILNFRKFRQSHELTVWRLVIKNTGRDTAREVQAEILEIKDEGNLRENFLPTTLSWTHLNKERRDVLKSQTVYLDVFNQIDKGPINRMDHHVIFASPYAQNIEDFFFLKPGESEIKLKLFQKNGSSQEIKLITKWDGTLLFDAKLKGGKWTWRKQL